MKNKILFTIAIFILGIIVYKSFLPKEEDYYTDQIDDLNFIPEDGVIPNREVLPQAWDDSIREAFWYTSQGSEIMPYDWFTWLEQPNNSKLFRNIDFTESLGYLPQKTSTLNPSGLPIGFTVTRARKNRKRGFGFNCAACHTNQLNYKGKKILIEGAPTLANFVKFYDKLTESLINTYTDDSKFDRFSKNVLQKNYSSSAASILRKDLEKIARDSKERQIVNELPKQYPKDFTANGRIDAFGNIANAGSAFGLHRLSNKNYPSAPVSYPFLWGTHQSDVVQWNASAPNTPIIGPLTRNMGEVVGVFGSLSIDPAPWWKQLIGFDATYSSTIDYEGLGKLESWIKDLRSPEWPESYLPALDVEKVSRGRIVYEEHCIQCHQVIPRENEGNPYIANKTLISNIGTDPMTAWNIKNHKAKTLQLEGSKSGILFGKKFEAEATAIEIPVNGVVGLIIENLEKAKKAGLAPSKQTGIKKEEIYLEELLEEHLKKRKAIEHKNTAEEKNAIGPNTFYKDVKGLVYKGRPLNGIWATAPFLHNGSVPNLWELLTLPENRIKDFYVGNREFDAKNVGFVINEGPSIFRVLKEDGKIMPGNSNLGHSYGTNLPDNDKWDLIEYMKSL